MGRVAVLMSGAQCRAQFVHARLLRRVCDALAIATFRSTITSDVMHSTNSTFVQALRSQHADITAAFSPFKQPYCHCLANDASLCSPCLQNCACSISTIHLQHPRLTCTAFSSGTHVISQVVANIHRVITCHELDVPSDYSSERYALLP